MSRDVSGGDRQFPPPGPIGAYVAVREVRSTWTSTTGELPTMPSMPSMPMPTPPPGPAEESLLSFAPLRNWAGYALRSVRRHLVTAFLTAVVVGVLGGMVVVGSAPTYQTSVTILLRTDNSGGDDGSAASIALDEASQQAEGVITSQASLDRIIDTVQLATDDGRLPVFGRLKKKIIDSVTSQQSDADLRNTLRDDLRSDLSAEPSPTGESIVITVTWPDPQKAKQIADLAFTIFFADRQAAEIKPKQDAVDILQQQTDAASAQVAQLRAALGLSPTADAPQGSDLQTAIGVERDLRTDLQQAQTALQVATTGLANRYALLEAAEVPQHPLSSKLVPYATLAVLVIVCAVGACVLIDRRRGRLLEPWELERFRVPVIAVVKAKRA